MTRKGILFFLTAVVLSCCHGNRALVQENTASDIVEASPLDSIFVSPRLQDSLRAFMELTDSISHSYWRKKTYQIIISKYDNFEQDTLIDIVLGGLTPMVIDIDYNPAGAVEDSSKVISVGYIHFDSLSEVVNERVLSMGLYNEYDVWNEKNQTWEDNLVLLSKYLVLAGRMPEA